MLCTMSKVNKWINVNMGKGNASTLYNWLVHLVDLFHLTTSRRMHCYLYNHKLYKGLAIGNQIHHVYSFLPSWNPIWVLCHLCKNHQLWFSFQKYFWFYLGWLGIWHRILPWFAANVLSNLSSFGYHWILPRVLESFSSLVLLKRMEK